MTGGEKDRGGAVSPRSFRAFRSRWGEAARRCIMGEKDKMLQKKASIIPMWVLALWKKLY